MSKITIDAKKKIYIYLAFSLIGRDPERRSCSDCTEAVLEEYQSDYLILRAPGKPQNHTDPNYNFGLFLFCALLTCN